MENLLKKIEGSENNNPLLTAALQEIGRLNTLIEKAKAILNATTHNTTCQVDDGPAYTPTFDELNDSKVDMLSNLFYF